MEIFDIVDENGNPTGQTIERSLAHTNGVRHRTVHIWIARKVAGAFAETCTDEGFLPR